MIGYLEGKIIDKIENNVIVSVNGVGYLVDVGLAPFSVDDDVALFVYTHVRENELTLYGFEDKEDKQLFHKLIGVSGIGPKVGVKLLNTLGRNSIINAILSEDKTGLKAPGVGPKLASKIILELKSSFEKDYANQVYDVSQNKNTPMMYDVLEALLALGYTEHEAKKKIEKIDLTEQLTLEEAVKQSLMSSV